MGDDNYTISDIIVGGRGNKYSGDREGRCAEPKPPKKKKQQPGGYGYGYPYAPPSPYPYPYAPPSPYQYPYPPPPPYQYGGYGYYGVDHAGSGYTGQFPPPNQRGYSYGRVAATGAPVNGHGQNDTVNKQLGHDHNHRGAAAGAAAGYYGGYHGPGYYPGQFPPPNQGGYNYGGAAATGAPVYGQGQPDTVNNQLCHDHNHGGAAAGAAANGDHGQQDAVNKHAHHDLSHGGGHMGSANAAAATAVYNNGQLVQA